MTLENNKISSLKLPDGRYENKFPKTYQILDILRTHYFDMTQEDIYFNGGHHDYFGSVETGISGIVHSSKRFFGVQDKKILFTFMVEKGRFPDATNHLSFLLRKKLLERENNEQILKFISKCTYDITGREINFVNSSENDMEFMYIPYDLRCFHDYLSLGDKMEYSEEYFLLFLQLYYDNFYRPIHYVSEDIIKRCNDYELAWLKSKIEYSKDDYLARGDDIEVGPNLSYIRIKK